MTSLPAPRRPARRRAVWTLLLTLLLAPLPVSAQTLHVGAGARADGAVHPDLWVRVEGVRPAHAAPATLAVELRGPRPVLGLALSTNQSFGPLGNLVFDVWGSLAEHPSGGTAAAEGAFSVRGVLGPAALRLTLLGFGADVGTFRPASLASAERPSLAGPAGGLQTSVTYRVSREVIVEAAPELYLTSGGLALRADGHLRLLRALGDNELRFDLHAYAAPGFRESAAAIGAAVTFPRGREPDVTVGAAVGFAPWGVWPGAHVNLGQRLGRVRLDLAAAIEPYRLDVPALRLSGSARVPVAGPLPAGAELIVDGALGATLGFGRAPHTQAFLGTALALPVQLP